MEGSTVFVLFLVLASAGALVGLEMHSRRERRKGQAAAEPLKAKPESPAPAGEQRPRGQRR